MTMSIVSEINEATEIGNLQRLAELLSQSPSLVNARDSQSDMPIHKAALEQQVDVLNFLLDHGADCPWCRR